LDGDANTWYFHTIANGWRRKCITEFMEDRDNRITKKRELVVHINDFYRKLFGREERGTIRMADSMW
jgi:hypothetical protein